MSTITIYIIYKITCIITGKNYIGQTCRGFNTRWNQHISDAKNGSNCVIHRSIRKHGENNFDHEILFSTNNPDIINEKEIEFIAKHDTFNNGYNMNEGGGTSYGYVHTKKSKKKMREKKLGGKQSKEHIMHNSGKNNHQFIGYWITPWGVFFTSIAAVEACPVSIDSKTIQRWCKNSDKIISNGSIVQSPYLQQLPESPLSKTRREIGFYFVRK